VVLTVAMLASCIQRETGIALGPSDDGKSFQARVGWVVRLSLPATVTWNLESTDTQQLQLIDTAVLSLGGEQTRVWNFKLTKAGVVTLRATPSCVPTTSSCPDHDLRFVIDVRQ
jgi:hypothetical protein